jgi:hypothetical protein
MWMAVLQAEVEHLHATARQAIAEAGSASDSAAAGWAAAERAAAERVAATGAAVAEHASAVTALAEVSAAARAARLAGEAGHWPSTGARGPSSSAEDSSDRGGVHGGRAAGAPAAATGAVLQAEAMRWLALMNADPVVGGRLSEVLAEMQEAQLQQDECTVCLDRPCSVTLLPCGHRVLCAECCSGVRAGNDEVRVVQGKRHGMHTPRDTACMHSALPVCTLHSEPWHCMLLPTHTLSAVPISLRSARCAATGSSARARHRRDGGGWGLIWIVSLTPMLLPTLQAGSCAWS